MLFFQTLVGSGNPFVFLLTGNCFRTARGVTDCPKCKCTRAAETLWIGYFGNSAALVHEQQKPPPISANSPSDNRQPVRLRIIARHDLIALYADIAKHESQLMGFTFENYLKSIGLLLKLIPKLQFFPKMAIFGIYF